VRQCGGGVWNVDVYVFYTSSTDPLQFQINGCYNCFKDVACKWHRVFVVIEDLVKDRDGRE
jgi:hypothetical protein